MTTPHSPQERPEGHRRPRAWLARRMTAVLSVVAMLGLGGLMYWNDQQSAANPAPAVANAPINSSGSPTNSSSSTSGTTSAKRSDHEDDGEHEHDGKHDDESKGEHESDDDGGSVVDEIAGWISGSSGSGASSSNPSNAGTAAQQTVPAPHTSTRGS